MTIKEREECRNHPFPISQELRRKDEGVAVTSEQFIEYYTKKFKTDLHRYYEIRRDFGDKTYTFVRDMKCFDSINIRRLKMKWRGLNHFYMFSAYVYFMSLCTQAIGKLYGWGQMENFMRAKGWPMLNCGMGGLMSPVQVILESELYPQMIEEKYYDVLHVASEHLIPDFLDFLNGKSENLNDKAYERLVKVVNPNKLNEEIRQQVLLFERWISDPDTRLPSSYVKFPTILNTPEKIHKDISSYLSQFEEEIPEWLRYYKEGAKVPFSLVMSDRIGYYPGSGYDGTLIKVCNISKSVHSFLYVDYGLSKKDLLNHLSQPNSILGYHSIGRIEWDEKDIMPNGQYPLNVNKRPLHALDPKWFVDPNEKPYCFTVIMERDADKDDDWGAKRFAVTFLFADGIATFYQLFCREYCKAPWIVLLQDHGFGGNYDRFGKGGILDVLMKNNEVFPEYVLCADGTTIWDGYEKVKGLPPVFGGMHHNSRQLYWNTRR